MNDEMYQLTLMCIKEPKKYLIWLFPFSQEKVG